MKKPTLIPETHSANELAMRNVANLVPETHLLTVVERVLDRKDNNKVAKPARQRLDAAIRDSGLKLRGYGNRTSSAPKALLMTPVYELMSRSDQLADAVLRIWIDTQKDLRRTVTEYAKANGFQAKGPDHRNRRFRVLTPLRTWNEATSDFQKNSKDLHDQYDVSIMLCMVTGSLPRLIGRSNGTTTPAIPIPPFEDWSEVLKKSFVSRAVAIVAEDFVKNANKILSNARQEEKRISALTDKSMELCREFMPELVFLGSELPANLLNPRRVLAGRAKSLEDVSNAVEQLGTALAAYRDASFPEFATWDLRHEGIQREMSAARDVNALVNQLYDVLPEPDELDEPAEPEVEPDQNLGDTTDDWDTLRAEILNLKTEYANLKKKNFALEQVVASLKGGINRTDPPETTPVESVGDAVERARGEFEGKGLLFYLNGASDLDTKFERPSEVLEALTWLATTYRNGRMEGGMPDPAYSLKIACSGWRYAPDSPDMAMNQRPEAYSTKAPDGKTYKLAPHVGKGTNNQAKYTIRIAFDWDEEQKMVVVGYIGKHQPSDY